MSVGRFDPRLPTGVVTKVGPGYMYHVYILESQKNGKFYIGHTDDLDRRLLDHNSGKVKSTRNYRPWVRRYAEAYPTRIEATRRELEIKSKKSRAYIIKLIGRHVPIENRDG